MNFSSCSSLIVHRSSFIVHRSSLIDRRVRSARLSKTTVSDEARITMPARPPLRVGVVAGVGQRIVDAEGEAATDDLGLGHSDERRDEARLTAFVSAARSSQNHLLEGV